MADEAGKEAWDHTAAIMALLINMHRDRHSGTVKPAELNPYRQKEARAKPKIKVPLTVLRDIFCK